MTIMTLRGIDDTIAAVLKDKTRQEETSVNAMMLRILKESLGIEKKKRSIWIILPAPGAHRRVTIFFALWQYLKKWMRICGNKTGIPL